MARITPNDEGDLQAGSRTPSPMLVTMIGTSAGIGAVRTAKIGSLRANPSAVPDAHREQAPDQAVAELREMPGQGHRGARAVLDALRAGHRVGVRPRRSRRGGGRQHATRWYAMRCAGRLRRGRVVRRLAGAGCGGGGLRRRRGLGRSRRDRRRGLGGGRGRCGGVELARVRDVGRRACRNSRTLRPSDEATSGSLPGPSTTSAMIRIRISSPGPMLGMPMKVLSGPPTGRSGGGYGSTGSFSDQERAASARRPAEVVRSRSRNRPPTPPTRSPGRH